MSSLLTQSLFRREPTPPCWQGWSRESTGLYPYPDEEREMKRQTTGAKPARQRSSGERPIPPSCPLSPGEGKGTCLHWWNGCPAAEKRGCFLLWKREREKGG